MKALLLAVLTTLGIIIGPAPAHAQPNVVDVFMNDLTAAGMNVTKDNEMAVLAMGLLVCVDVFSGNSTATESAQVVDTAKVTHRQADLLVNSALHNLCPMALNAGRLN